MANNRWKKLPDIGTHVNYIILFQLNYMQLRKTNSIKGKLPTL